MKKLLSIFLVLAMTISLAVPMVSAAEFSDVDTKHQYYSAIQSLVARGIVNGMGDGSFAPDANVTRAQFAKMVVLSIGINNAGESVDSSGFPDVPSTHWAAGFVKAAHGQGIINGFEDGSFRPEENVTYEQAITMAIRAKSLFLKAEAEKIGYPEGYIQLAGKYKFLRGIVDGVNKQPAKRGTIAQLMDNMLKVELSDDIGGIPQIETDNVEEVKGQIVAVKGTSLIEGDSDSLNTYQFKLKETDGDIVIYDAKNLSVKDSLRSYLGKQVVVYYEEDAGARVQFATSMNEQRNRNYEVTVTLDAVEDYTNTLVKYDDGGEIARMSVLRNALIMYNGSLTSSDLETLITNNLGKAGSIRFLCSEGEGAPADIIFFTSYTNWHVTSTTLSSKTVFGEIGETKSNIVVDDEARGKTVTITKDGKKVSFSSIKKGQILSISKSDDEKVIDVIISDKTVSGIVTAKNDSLNNITVLSKIYGFTDGLTTAGINLGVTLKLYIDAFGKVAKYTHQMTSTDYVYGYLLKASIDGNSMNPRVAMSILDIKTTATPTPTNLYLADSVTINNANYKPVNSADAILTLLKETAGYYGATSGLYNFTADEVCQPIRYSKGSDGKINALYIGTQDVAATESDLKVDRTFADIGVSCTTAGSSPQFNPHFKLNSSTPVVFVPTSDDDRTLASKYKVVTAGNAKFTQGSSYKLIAVDTKNLVPMALVVYKDPGAVASTEWESCVPKVVTGKRIVPGRYEVDLQGYNDSNAVTYYDTDGAFYSAVSEGDVVRVSADAGMKVDEYEISAKATEVYAGNEYIRPIQHSVSDRVVDMTGASMNGTRSQFDEGDRSVTRKITLYAGVAYDIQEDGVTMRLVTQYPNAGTPWALESLTNANTKLINTSGAKVVAVDMSGAIVNSSDIEVIDVGQIQTYTHDGVLASADKLIVYCFGNSARLIVVYKAGN